MVEDGQPEEPIQYAKLVAPGKLRHRYAVAAGSSIATKPECMEEGGWNGGCIFLHVCLAHGKVGKWMELSVLE